MSRFVSAGKIDAASGEVVAAGAGDAPGGAEVKSARALQKQDEWEAVQKELEAERARRDEQRAKMVAGEEKSLYDILQANKAAKQAAFEEQTRIKNQFRSLDDDEVDFLAGVRDSERQDEERRRRETEDELRHFREARRERERGVDSSGRDEEEALAEGEDWGAVGRKRKRDREASRLVRGVKRRASDGRPAGDGEKSPKEGEAGSGAVAAAARPEDEVVKTSASPPVKPKMLLVAYGSDEDDEDDD